MGTFGEVFNGGYTLPPEVQSIIQRLQSQTQGNAPLSQNQPGFQSASNYLQDLLNPDSEAMRAYQEPAMRQFQQEIIPGIAERFSLGNEKGSSAFQNSLTQAGGNLSAQLNQQRGQQQMQALPLLLQLLQMPFDQFSKLSDQLLNAPYAYQEGI